MKKLLYISSATLIIAFLLIFLPFFLRKDTSQVIDASEIETSEWFQGRVQDYKIILCNFDFKNPAYTFVYENKFEDLVDHKIQFYEVSRDSIFSQNFQPAEYTGGATIKDTTFNELVKMVKDDCGQFQKARGGQEDEAISWSYSPATPPPPPPTQEEIDQHNEMAVKFLVDKYNNYYPETQELFKEIYGDVNQMSDEQLIELVKRIDKEDGEDERISIKEMIIDFDRLLLNLTDQQKQLIIETYGSWEDLSDEELVYYHLWVMGDITLGNLVLE